MLESSLEKLLATAWRRLGFPPIPVEVHPSDKAEFGDFSSNLALVGAKQAKASPRDLAARLVDALPKEAFSRVEVAGPGFLNLFLTPQAIHAALAEILDAGERFGDRDLGAGASLQIEFVSSNPTGPLTVGHGRQAVLGDVLAALYEACGYRVTREYYFNDEGHQVDLLAQSLWARYRQARGTDEPIPEGGYRGEYLVELASELTGETNAAYETFDEPVAAFFRDTAVTRLKAKIREDLEALRVRFDNWFSEADLHRSGAVQDALDALHEHGGTYEEGGAVWLAAQENGGTKDAVLVKSDGSPTYLLVDIAYHLNKLQRGFSRVIDVQGADHQVEQAGVKAALKLLGVPEGFLDYAVHQFVSLKEQGETARMSTRAGRFILLRELVSELGADVVRYFMIERKPGSHLQFDLELARTESLDNPVHYIQYAHTRIASIFRKAEWPGFDPTKADLSPLVIPAERDLIKQLDVFPRVVESAAVDFSPHLLAEYALGLARAFHAYYTDHRVLGETEALTAARLALLHATRTVLRRCLRLLGMSVPEAM
jgi:arginyl-tRNA synthetase